MTARKPSSRVFLNPASVWRLLDRLKISQNRLAHLCGVSSGYMSQLVCGRRSPSPRVQRQIQQVIGEADLDDLFVTQPVATARE